MKDGATHAILCLRYNADTYPSSAFDWARKLAIDKGAVEIKNADNIFVAPYAIAFSILMEISIHQKHQTIPKPVRPLLFPCLSQAFGVFEEELKEVLAVIGLEVMGADYPPKEVST